MSMSWSSKNKFGTKPTPMRRSVEPTMCRWIQHTEKGVCLFILNEHFISPELLKLFILSGWMHRGIVDFSRLNAWIWPMLNITALLSHSSLCASNVAKKNTEIYVKYKLKHIFPISFSRWRTAVGITHFASHRPMILFKILKHSIGML